MELHGGASKPRSVGDRGHEVCGGPGLGRHRCERAARAGRQGSLQGSAGQYHAGKGVPLRWHRPACHLFLTARSRPVPSRPPTPACLQILNVFFADMPSLQLGDSSTTLGLIFAAGAQHAREGGRWRDAGTPGVSPCGQWDSRQQAGAAAVLHPAAECDVCLSPKPPHPIPATCCLQLDSAASSAPSSSTASCRPLRPRCAGAWPSRTCSSSQAYC